MLENIQQCLRISFHSNPSTLKTHFLFVLSAIVRSHVNILPIFTAQLQPGIWNNKTAKDKLSANIFDISRNKLLLMNEFILM